MITSRERLIESMTPWGRPMGTQIFAEGIVFYLTEDRDGFKLSSERNAEVHALWRTETGWYEEGEEWAVVVFTYPERFTNRERALAHQTLKACRPLEYERISGQVLAPGDSEKKDELAFQEQHKADWVVLEALRSLDHPGMLECTARLGGSQRYSQVRRYLVPEKEYRGRSRFGFVIDERRHTLTARCEVLDPRGLG